MTPSTEQSRNEPSRGRAAAAWWSFGLLVGLSIGASMGFLLSPLGALLPSVAAEVLASPPATTSGDAPPPPAVDPDSDLTSEALAEAWMTNLWLTGKIRSLESAIDQIEALDVDPRLLADRVVSSLSQDELRATISMATRLGDEELDQIQDLDAFALRLTDIALEGTLVDEADPLDAGEVRFGTMQSGATDPAMLSNRFDPDERRIYAFFSAEDYAGREVMVKWYRTDQPKIMVFKRHAIRQSGEAEYVWLQPRAGWESGDYRVDVYSGDEAMTQLAMGRYSVE